MSKITEKEDAPVMHIDRIRAITFREMRERLLIRVLESRGLHGRVDRVCGFDSIWPSPNVCSLIHQIKDSLFSLSTSTAPAPKSSIKPTKMTTSPPKVRMSDRGFLKRSGAA